MRAILSLMTVFAVFGGGFLVNGAGADEEKVPLDKLPKPVLEAVKKRFPKADLLAASKEMEDKKTVYEVTVKNEGQKIDVTVTPEGTLVGLEKEIAAKDLPMAVAKTLTKSYPKAVYKRIEEVIKVKDGKETLDFYEVLLNTADKKTLEVKIAPSGKLLGTENNNEKKEEKK